MSGADLMRLSLILCFLCVQADQVWHGDSTPNVLDENLIIRGACQLTDNHKISAIAHDVVVTVESYGDEEPIVRGAGKVLELITAAGHEITFSIIDSNNLAFEGGYNEQNPDFLRIIQRGPGTVRWKINGDRTITLRNSTKTDATGGYGVRYFISMENATNGVIIQRGNSNNLHAGFEILDNSLMTFIAPTKLADTPTERGAILFDTSNSNGSGRTYVELGEQAGLIFSGHYVANLTDPALVSVDLSQPAGKEVLCVINSPNSTSDYASLLVINANKILPQLYCDPTRTGRYTGVQSGFILGTNSSTYIKNNAYLDFVGTTTNTSPLTSSAAVLDGRIPEKVLKNRNASALIIDGAPSGTAGACDARLFFEGDSGLFLRSGADTNGYVVPMVDTGFSFTISPTCQLTGAGNIVFDVEGALYMLGSETGTSVINILSREVASSGGKIEIGVGGAYFPKITFAQDAHLSDYLAQYAKACCFINNRVNLSHVIVRHDDFFHIVNAVNTPYNSEPTYVGGDTFKLVPAENINRPRLAFYNSSFNLHTSTALTGLDLFITNTSLDISNTSYVRFYQNGYIVDSGSGRALVLGTNPGSYAYDYASIIDNVSYLDIYQEVNQNPSYSTHDLNLVTAVNDSTVIPEITGNISTQYSIQTLFLGNASNIQIGSQSDIPGLELTTWPTLNINGNFFSFMTQGGSIGQPALSAATGEGGLFIDKNGMVGIASTSRAHFGMMVVQGDPTGIVDLPSARVDFAPQVGLSRWAINLSQSQEIVFSGSSLAEFTLDWMSVTKDYAGGFVPFVPIGAIGTTVTESNLYHIPEIYGTVQRFQIKRSRIGDPVHLLIGENGLVRELSFLKGYDSAEAANGVIVLKDEGRVGLGNSQQNRDSTNAAVVLGINGVTLVADGNGIVDLNEDILIDHTCHIIAGPHFGVGGVANELHIDSDNPVEVRVKRGGVLDLSSFTTSDQRITFGGNVSLIFEPGAILLLGGGTLRFTNKSILLIQNEINDSPSTGTRVTSTDDVRVKFIGTGAIVFDEDASMLVQKNSYLGIEWYSLLGAIINTDFTLSIRDNAGVHIGSDTMWGGALQVGNTANKIGAVSLHIELDGLNAMLEINKQGFFGVGAGVVDKHSSIPNNWFIGSLYNVDTFKIHVKQGFFRHNQITDGTSSNAALLAIGPASKYYFLVDDNFAYRALGGGNMVRIGSSVTKVSPTVLSTAYIDSSSDIKAVGLFASTALFIDSSNKNLISVMAAQGGTAQDFFNVIRTKKVPDLAIYMSNFAQLGLGNNLCGYVFKYSNLTQDSIERLRCTKIMGIPGAVPPEHSLAIGAVSLDINSETGVLTSVKQIV